MSSYSMAVVVGHLVRDPDLKYTQTGMPITSMTVAVNRRIPGRDGGEARDEASFIDVKTFGKTALAAAERLKKGDKTLVEGRLKQERWEDRNSGQQRSRVVVLASWITFLGSKAAPSEESGGREREPGEDDLPY